MLCAAFVDCVYVVWCNCVVCPLYMCVCTLVAHVWLRRVCVLCVYTVYVLCVLCLHCVCAACIVCCVCVAFVVWSSCVTCMSCVFRVCARCVVCVCDVRVMYVCSRALCYVNGTCDMRVMCDRLCYTYICVCVPGVC